MAILNLNKPPGWTPLQALERLRVLNPDLKDESMVYAGRLDPMAEGVLVVLSGDDRYRKDEFLNLDKTYKATFLFGFETDSYDALGLANKVGDPDVISIENELRNLKGLHPLPFPSYSSYKIKGKPLHVWTREGRLDEIEIPIKKMGVLEVRDIKITTLKSRDVLQEITDRIGIVKGNFRQDEIAERWNEILKENLELTIASLTLKVTSGTYIRSLAQELGQKLGCGAILLNLKRTKVGELNESDSIILI